MNDFEARRHKMVEEQIRARGIQDEQVLRAMTRVERHRFVPARARNEAYDDNPLSIGFQQTISQPYIVAYMTEALGIGEGARILEIGTGSGYQTAVLAEIATEVYSMEVVEALGQAAQERLDKLGYWNISFRLGNGRLGWPDAAPFDGILAAAAPEILPAGLIQQLRPGASLLIPMGLGKQTLMRYTRTESAHEAESLLAVRFVPLI